MFIRRMSQFWFQVVHRNNLIYNTCWEDPRLDREALRLGPNDRVMTITSAGCNVLDYALAGPAHIDAVDLNPRQNALLELKRAAIHELEYEEFFAMFGRGRLESAHWTYAERLRPRLPEFARRYWDRHIGFFGGHGTRDSFYFRGTAGWFARLANRYLDRVARVRDALEEILESRTIEEQRAIYERRLRAVLWKRSIRWLVGRDATLALLGVPRPQREQVERDYTGGIVQFIQDCIHAVFAQLPLADNYFWRVYLTGQYTPDCCPEYLKRENFARLKAGLVDRFTTHTCSVVDFLRRYRGRLSHFVLLDHMDWLAASDDGELAREWQAIIGRAAPEARILWRSGGLRTDFVDRVSVRVDGLSRTVGELLEYDRELAAKLHPLDRVHTYGSFSIARLNAA